MKAHSFLSSYLPIKTDEYERWMDGYEFIGLKTKAEKEKCKNRKEKEKKTSKICYTRCWEESQILVPIYSLPREPRANLSLNNEI